MPGSAASFPSASAFAHGGDVPALNHPFEHRSPPPLREFHAERPVDANAVDLPLEIEVRTPSDARLELTAIALVCSAIGALLGAVLALVLGRATQLPGAEGVAVFQSAVAGTLLCAAAGATACGLFGTLIGWHLSGMPMPLLESDWEMQGPSAPR